MAVINHQNNFATNLTSGVNSSDTTSPLNSIPTVAAPFYLAFDATNINGHYEVVYCTSKTATNVNHAALTYDHTTAEEVRMVVPATEMDDITTTKNTGWVSVSDTWAFASDDDPTFTITVPSGAASIYSVGMKLKLTNTTVKYFIITKVADTVLTVYGGTDYNLVAAAISNIYYSTQKAPPGFPLNPTVWTIETQDTSNRQQLTPTQNQWYNIGSITIAIPIGLWSVEWYANCGGTEATFDMQATLSTANNSESDADFTADIYAAAVTSINVDLHRRKPIELTTKATHYLNGRTRLAAVDEINFYGAVNKTIVRATCLYL